jgi:phage baseplate assembly protein W
MSDPSDFIGRGVMWPMRVDQSGSIAMTHGADDLGSSIRMVLSTAPGERLMRPNFGCAIWELMFEPVNANTMGLMARSVRDALGQWEPRIDVTDVRVIPDVTDELKGSQVDVHGRVHIEVDYRVKATNDRRNLVFPFYVIPMEETT